MKILLTGATGATGFIGMTTALRLLARGDEVIGLDNLNDYYDMRLKHDRLARLTDLPGFRFVQMTRATAPAWSSCLPPSASTASSAWPRRPACAIR